MLPLGADSTRVPEVQAAARRAIGDEFPRLYVEGVALGDTDAVALARRIVRTGPEVEDGG